MQLPQSYLADLPAEAELTPNLITEAWYALQRNHERNLAPLRTAAVIEVLAEASRRWLEPDSPFMRLALELGPAQLGFSRQTLQEGLEQLFASVTAPHLEAWIEQDLGHPQRLDEFCATGPERSSRRRAKAVGPQALVHITAGNLPASAVMSMTAGLLVRSPQFIKCATGTSLIPRLHAHAIREASLPLGSCLEVAEWPRKHNHLLTALLDQADCVTATGSDETLTALRQQVPVGKRFLGHGHRLSFIYIARDMLAVNNVPRLIESVTADVSSWNQLGCLSPHVVYVESGGVLTPEQFAAELATGLERMEQANPRGPLSEREATTIRSRRAFYEVRAAHSPDTQLWQSAGSTAWTVVYEAEPQFQSSCLNRFVYVKCTSNLEETLQSADRVHRQVSTVALAATGSRWKEMINRLATWGVHRICPVGSMQKPPVVWRHDGRPALGELVWWTDLEEL